MLGMVYVLVVLFNNYWGVLLMLVCMVKDVDYGVFEIGMNYLGEICVLVLMVWLDIVIIIMVVGVYLGNFCLVEEIVYVKLEIFEGIEVDGYVIFNCDIEYFLIFEKVVIENWVLYIYFFGNNVCVDF